MRRRVGKDRLTIQQARRLGKRGRRIVEQTAPLVAEGIRLGWGAGRNVLRPISKLVAVLGPGPPSASGAWIQQEEEKPGFKSTAGRQVGRREGEGRALVCFLITQYHSLGK